MTVFQQDLHKSKIIRSFRGHKAQIHCLEFAPDRKSFASGDDTGEIRLWNLSTGKETACLKGHKGAVTALAFGNKGLLSAGNDKIIRLWDLSTYKIHKQFTGHSRAITQLEPLAGKKGFLSAGQDGTVKQWLYDRNTPVKNLVEDEEAILTIDSKSGKRLLTANSSGDINYWNLDDNTLIAKTHSDTRVNSVTLSKDKEVAYIACDSGLWTWTIGHLSPDSCRKVSGNALICQESPDGQWCMAAGNGSSLEIWPKDNGLIIPLGGVASINSYSFTNISSDGALVCAANDQQVVLWDRASQQILRRTKSDKGRLTHLSFQPNSYKIMTTTDKGVLSCWDPLTRTYAFQQELSSTSISQLVYSPIKPCLSVVSGSRVVVWDYQKQATIQSFDAGSAVAWLDFHPKKMELAVENKRGQILIYDVESGKQRFKLKGWGRASWGLFSNNMLIRYKGGRLEMRRVYTDDYASGTSERQVGAAIPAKIKDQNIFICLGREGSMLMRRHGTARGSRRRTFASSYSRVDKLTFSDSGTEAVALRMGRPEVLRFSPFLEEPYEYRFGLFNNSSGFDTRKLELFQTLYLQNKHAWALALHEELASDKSLEASWLPFLPAFHCYLNLGQRNKALTALDRLLPSEKVSKDYIALCRAVLNE